MVAERQELYDRFAISGDSAYDSRLLEPLAARPEFACERLDTTHARISICRTGGHGLPLLFLHGNSSCKEVFDRQFRSVLGQAHQCIGIDLPGHGSSDNARVPSETYSIAGYADVVAEVLERLDIDQFALVGWSLGGHVALEVAASSPGVVGAFISSAPPMRTGFRGIFQGFRLHPLATLLATANLSDEQSSELARVILGPDPTPTDKASIRQTDGRARELIFKSMLSGDHVDQREFVETSTIPLAIINGANDPFIDTRYLEKLKYANPWGGRCHILPSAGHAPFLTAAPLFNHLLASFARDMERRASELRERPQLVYAG